MSKQQKFISKSRFVAALYCPKRCWLEHHEPLPYEDKTDPLIQMGNQIGKLAQTLFPNGVLIDEKPWQRDEAEERTARLMNDEGVDAIFEAAFSNDGLAVRVDILERGDDCWNILEVKSSTSCKDSHVWDVGIQERVVSGASVSVGTCEMVLVDTSYILSSEGLDPHKLLKRLDVSDRVDERRQQIEDQLNAHRNILALETCPDTEPAFQCQSPWPCGYLDQCTAGFPDDWIINLPRLNEKKYVELRELGYLAVSDLDDKAPVKPEHLKIAKVIIDNKPWLAPDIATALKPFGPPASYLDFETTSSAIPSFPGTKPYEAIAFQWSLHCVDENWNLSHEGFLAEHDGSDPRRAFLETLLAALEQHELPIIVYSSYERTILNKLSAQFSDLRERTATVIERLQDLLVVTRSSICHPKTPYGNSIKTVGPALAPHLTYDDLDTVADGSMASFMYALIVAGALPNDLSTEQIRDALWRYCERDTVAMVEVHKALLKMAAENETERRLEN